MIRQSISILLISILPLLFFSACMTAGESSTVLENSETNEDFLPRPRFEKPVTRPLGRVLLQWNAIKDADGYEIQMAEEKDFIQAAKSWTVRGLNLEIPVAEGSRLYFRIRSFNTDFVSRWSTVLAVQGASG